MANKVTGTTDTSGALTTTPVAVKSVLVVGNAEADQTADKNEKEIFSITGTADASAAFGKTSIASQVVRTLISGGVNNIKGIIIASGEEGTELADTLAESLSDKTIKVVICLDNKSETITAVKDHLTVAESNDMFRYSVFAPEKDSTVDQIALTNFAKIN